MIFFRATKYLKYILLSGHRRGHGIHSPFVFDLVSRVFRNKIDPDIVCSIEKLRKRLKADKRKIIVSDLGSGSELLKTNIRKVSEIARKSPVPEKYGVLLSNMAAEFGKQGIIELGTSFGISTIYMASACRDADIFTIEGSSSVAEIARENFRSEGIKNIELFTGSFDETLPCILGKNVKPGMVFIDGDHRREPVVRYFSLIAEMSDSKTVVIIDDINHSEEMGEAWKQIKGDSRVTLTIDLNRMGIVFFREGIAHNDYVIRY
jgi:predicted O-methyltransferase YrrM